MIDFNSGIIQISDDLRIYRGFSFDEFRKTSFYTGQDPERSFYLNDKQCVDGRNYRIGLFFRSSVIYMVSLICCDKVFDMETEPERKNFHDLILKEYNINSRQTYDWGRVSSNYEPRGNISSIDVTYFAG